MTSAVYKLKCQECSPLAFIRLLALSICVCSSFLGDARLHLRGFGEL